MSGPYPRTDRAFGNTRGEHDHGLPLGGSPVPATTVVGPSGWGTPPVVGIKTDAYALEDHDHGMVDLPVPPAGLQVSVYAEAFGGNLNNSGAGITNIYGGNGDLLGYWLIPNVVSFVAPRRFDVLTLWDQSPPMAITAGDWVWNAAGGPYANIYSNADNTTWVGGGFIVEVAVNVTSSDGLQSISLNGSTPVDTPTALPWASPSATVNLFSAKGSDLTWDGTSFVTTAAGGVFFIHRTLSIYLEP
jgi:hypothetical protein